MKSYDFDLITVGGGLGGSRPPSGEMEQKGYRR
jgi:hypothetical protein